MADARRALSSVVFSTEPNLGGMIRPAHAYDSPDLPSLPGSQYGLGQGGDMSRRTSVFMPTAAGDDQFSDTASRNGQFPRSPLGGGYDSGQSPYMAPGRQSLSYIDPSQAEFGVLPPEPYSPRVSSSLRGAEERERLMGPRNSRFSTAPGLGGPRPPPGARDSGLYPPPRDNDRPPSIDIERPEDSFSSSIAEALGERFEFENKDGANGQESSVLAPGHEAADGQRRSTERTSFENPPPLYTPEALDGERDADLQLAYMSPEEETDKSPERRSREDRKVKFEASSPDAGGVPRSSQEIRHSGEEKRHDFSQENGQQTAQQSNIARYALSDEGWEPIYAYSSVCLTFHDNRSASVRFSRRTRRCQWTCLRGS